MVEPSRLQVANLSAAMDYETFVDDMKIALPWYEPSNPDLPHVALGGLVSNLAHERTANRVRYAGRVAEVLRFIEEAAASTDVRVDNLIQVSFIENLHLLGDDCANVISRFDPRTTKLHADYENEWGKVCPEVS
jgi:hypothetical protein